MTTFVTSFSEWAYEGISNNLHNKRQKEFVALENVDLARNNFFFFHLEDSIIMYGIYNAEKI